MNSIPSARVITGVAIRTRTLVTSTVQTRIGIRKRVIPGSRILKMVTRKLIAPRIELVPMRVRDTIHRSWPELGELSGPILDSGGGGGAGAAAPPPLKKP